MTEAALFQPPPSVERSDAPAFAMGLTYDLPIEQYHADTSSVSKSGLDSIEKSPGHFFALHRAPGRPVIAPTPPMFAGTLAHCAILEPDAFDARYVVGPDVDHRSKDWKDFVKNVGPGSTVISAEQRAIAFAQASAVRMNPQLAEALSEGHAEVTARWVDEETGVICRCRPDWVWPAGDGVIILDVKTCKDASRSGFARSIANYRYHVQDAFYWDGFEVASGLQVHGFIFAAVESAYPFAAAAYMLAEEDLEAGRRAYRRNLALYAECMRSNTWPGYPDEVQVIALPRWAQQTEGDR